MNPQEITVSNNNNIILRTKICSVHEIPQFQFILCQAHIIVAWFPKDAICFPCKIVKFTETKGLQGQNVGILRIQNFRLYFS